MYLKNEILQTIHGIKVFGYLVTLMNVVVIAVYIDFNTNHDQKLSVHNYLKIFDDDFEIVWQQIETAL